MLISPLLLASTIEHTNLKPIATSQQIAEVCNEALTWQFYGVCIYSGWIPLAYSLLKNSGVKIITVAGFPHGAVSTSIKCKEIEAAVHAGANEIDFVLNIGWIKEQAYQKVEEEFKELKQVSSSTPLKVILETCYLNDQDKELVCRLAADTGIHFVKTSTGYGTAGATLADVQLMKRFHPHVKASGGIKDLTSAVAFIEAGASRLGTSSGPSLMEELQRLNITILQPVIDG